MPNAVITGATQGIGKAIAEKLLAEGFSIAFCARTADDVATLKAEWQQQYPSATIVGVAADLAKKEDVLEFGAAVLDEFAELDILVNNAGYYVAGNLETEPDGHLESLMAVNLYSAYHLTRRVLPALHHSRKGHIFNICSVASLQAYHGGGSYSITKYALLGFSDNLRHELKDTHIRVTAISPGAVYSRSWSGSGVAESRIMKPSDVADMLWAAYSLSSSANVEHIVMRPQKGDL
jgi:NADP-dependent 3-hydroxy acid dehydrogenase YdfG